MVECESVLSASLFNSTFFGFTPQNIVVTDFRRQFVTNTASWNQSTPGNCKTRTWSYQVSVTSFHFFLRLI